MFARRILPAFVVLALVGAGWVAWAELKLHWHTPMASRSGVVETALALGLPAIVVMVLPMFAARAEGRQDVASYYPRFGETPVLINMFFGALVVGFVVLAFALQPRPDERGAPAILNGEYVLDNHGKITVVDKPTYDHEMATFTDRFPNTVVGGVGALDALAAAITTGWAFQLRSDTYTESQYQLRGLPVPTGATRHAQHDRIVEIRDNLQARIAEAQREVWLGEVEGLQISLAGANDKLAQIDRRRAADQPVDLGLPMQRSPTTHK